MPGRKTRQSNYHSLTGQISWASTKMNLGGKIDGRSPEAGEVPSSTTGGVRCRPQLQN